MANLLDFQRLSNFVGGIVDRKIRSITISITSATAYLSALVQQSKGYADASQSSAADAQDSASEASGAASSTLTVWNSFTSTYGGVKASDPTQSSLGSPFLTNAFYVRSSDGRLRYVTAVTNGVPTWRDATVTADPNSLVAAGDGKFLSLTKTTNQTVAGPTQFQTTVLVPDTTSWTSNQAAAAKNVKTIVDAVASSVSSEVTRAQQAEANLQTAVTNEQNRAQGVENTLNTSVTNLNTTKFDKTGGSVSGVVSASSVISRGGNLVSQGSGSEGGQLVLGFVNTAPQGQTNDTWNVDVDPTNRLRFFSVRGSSGVVTTPLTIDAVSGVASFGVTPTVNGSLIWSSANDGAGSGMDADLLDGRDGSYYTDVANRLGYIPANKIGDSFGGNVAISYQGNPRLIVESQGVVACQLAAQADGNLVFYRVTNSTQAIWATDGVNLNISLPITRQGNRVWDSGNDGSGSGLDADLLDGQDGSYYANVAARLGYIPANKIGDSFGGNVAVSYQGNPRLIVESQGVVSCHLAAQSDGNIVLYRVTNSTQALWSADGNSFNLNTPITRQGNKVWDSGNDGAGSGMDADLLDGQDGGYYTNISARLGYVPANKGGDSFSGDISVNRNANATLSLNSGAVVGRLVSQADGNLVLYRNSGSGDVAVFGSDGGSLGVNMPITRQGNKVWDSGNDGAGSGMDADLLDGLDGSQYAKQADLASFLGGNGSGWQKLPGGLIIQWGTSIISSGDLGTVTFPIVFPNGVFSTFATTGAGENEPPTAFVGVATVTNTGLKVKWSKPLTSGNYGCSWLALGY